MFRRSLLRCCSAVLVASLVACAAGAVRAAGPADVKALESQMEKLLDAYNRDDVKAFFADWAKAVEAIATEATYDALFRNMAKKELGNYVPKTVKLRTEGSVLEGDFLVVYFDVEFASAKQGMAAVNFQQEGGAFKFIQVQLGKRP